MDRQGPQSLTNINVSVTLKGQVEYLYKQDWSAFEDVQFMQARAQQSSKSNEHGVICGP